jgi:cytoskeletal protein CcmA (bactofilin family)
MLKTGKKTEDDKSLAFDKSTEQETLTPALRPGNTAEKTVIGENIYIEGNIRGDEHLVIEGSMKGNLEM